MKNRIKSALMLILIIAIGGALIGAASGSYRIGFLVMLFSVAFHMREERHREKRAYRRCC